MQRLTHPSTSTGRRIGVSFLLAVLLAPMLSLCLSASDLAGVAVAACCRAHGKHHCAMDGMDAASSSDGGTTFHAQLLERCPYQSAAPVTQGGNSLGDLVAVPAEADFQAESTVLPASQLPLVTSASRAHPKRGPPAVCLS